MRIATIFVVIGCLLGRSAWAEKNVRKVRIVTKPKGATVYLGDKADGPDGKTPLEIKLPLGKTPIVIELDNYTSVEETIRVNKPKRKDRRKPQVFTWTLMETQGSISVDGPMGATALVDGVEVGTVPGTFQVAPGRRVVKLVVNGVEGEDKTIDVTAGGEATVVAFNSTENGTSSAPPATDGPITADTTPSTPGISAKAPQATPRYPLVIVSLRYEFSTRTFRYQGEDASAMLVEVPRSKVSNVGVEAALYPFRATGVRVLHPLSLHGLYLFGIPQAVKTGDLGFSETFPPETFQQTIEGSLRYRFTFRERYGFELDPGFGRYQYQFSGVDSDIERLPHIAYSTVRIGGRFVTTLWKIDAYAGGEYRLLLSGGEELDKKFPAGTSGNGFAARFGASLPIGKWLLASAETSYSGYGLDFASTEGDENSYTGGSDRVFSLSVGFGGNY